MLIRNYQQHDIHLVFTGDSLTGNTISACVKQMGLAGMVHFLGYVRDEELAAVWHNAYFLIFPSLFEGFGIPLVEALMYGKPILASNATSIPEVAGDAALYFDPRKPDEIAAVLHTIISDEGRCRELVERGRKQLQNYSFSSMLERYRSVLYRAAEKGCRADCTEVFGIFDDCWAGPSIEIVLGSSKSRRMLEMRGFIPDWHPSSKMKISFSAGRRYTLRKHEELVIREYFPGEAGNAHIDVSGGFVPGNGDPRTLTFMVKQAFIIDEATGKKIYELRGRPA